MAIPDPCSDGKCRHHPHWHREGAGYQLLAAAVGTPRRRLVSGRAADLSDCQGNSAARSRDGSAGNNLDSAWYVGTGEAVVWGAVSYD